MSKFGDFKDKAVAAASEHDEQIDQGLGKAGEMAKEKTGGKYDEQIDQGTTKAQNAL